MADVKPGAGLPFAPHQPQRAWLSEQIACLGDEILAQEERVSGRADKWRLVAVPWHGVRFAAELDWSVAGQAMIWIFG
jgi:hypothetical protein